MKVILPVAGKGERMRPYTGNPPKCLLPVGDKTIIGRIVEDALPLGPTETPFITEYKAEALDGFLKRRPGWGRTRTVLQSDPQGLGQATSQDIRRAFPATFSSSWPRIKCGVNSGGDPLAVRGRGGLSRHKIAASRRNFSA